jgi:hypothetical protein
VIPLAADDGPILAVELGDDEAADEEKEEDGGGVPPAGGSLFISGLYRYLKGGMTYSSPVKAK